MTYRVQLASAVGERDGLAVELVDERGEQVAEVFRDHADGGVLRVNSFREFPLPFDEFLLIQAAESEFC